MITDPDDHDHRPLALIIPSIFTILQELSPSLQTIYQRKMLGNLASACKKIMNVNSNPPHKKRVHKKLILTSAKTYSERTRARKRTKTTTMSK
jgi:hypothetical protein